LLERFIEIPRDAEVANSITPIVRKHRLTEEENDESFAPAACSARGQCRANRISLVADRKLQHAESAPVVPMKSA